MISNPYEGLYPEVVEVLSEFINSDDENDYHRKHARRLARTLHLLMEQSPSGRILELGTSGIIPSALARIFPDIEIDVTNFDTSMGKKHTFVSPYGGKFSSFCLDLESEELPVKDETYDWVLCCEVIEHLDVDPMFMMCEINRVLKPEGHILLTTPNIVSTRGLVSILNGYEPYFYMQYHKDRSPYRHNYEYSIHSLKSVMVSAGFDGSIWTENNFMNPIQGIEEKLGSIGFFPTHTGDNIITIAKKISGVVHRYPSSIYVDD